MKVQYDVSGSLEVANMTETANKSKIGEGDGRKMTRFGKNLCGLGRGAEEFLGK